MCYVCHRLVANYPKSNVEPEDVASRIGGRNPPANSSDGDTDSVGNQPLKRFANLTDNTNLDSGSNEQEGLQHGKPDSVQ